MMGEEKNLLGLTKREMDQCNAIIGGTNISLSVLLGEVLGEEAPSQQALVIAQGLIKTAVQVVSSTGYPDVAGFLKSQVPLADMWAAPLYKMRAAPATDNVEVGND